MRYNNVKFIEPLAVADALTARQAHEMASRASGTRRRLRQGWIVAVCAVLLGMMGSALADHHGEQAWTCLLYTSPSPRDLSTSRMPSSA